MKVRWTAEDMENNVITVRESAELHNGAAELTQRTVELAARLSETDSVKPLERGGRKAHKLR